MENIWEEKYKVTSYLVNLRQRAGLYATLNLIQDIGWVHAFNTKIKLPKNQGWVFTRQNLKMDYWPKWNEVVTIKTWLRTPIEKAFFYRDYELFVDEKKIGQCTSSFTIMNLETRKREENVNLSLIPNIWQENYSLDQKPKKINWLDNVSDVASFKVRNSDLDMNNHVNNTKYAQWVLDSLSLEDLTGNKELCEYDINFLSEAKSDDEITVQTSGEQSTDENFWVQFQGVRNRDQKPIFVVQLKFKKS